MVLRARLSFHVAHALVRAASRLLATPTLPVTNFSRTIPHRFRYIRRHEARAILGSRRGRSGRSRSDSRNGYGAPVLSANSLMFVDVDRDEPPPVTFPFDTLQAEAQFRA